jgi:hypothetical protein
LFGIITLAFIPPQSLNTTQRKFSSAINRASSLFAAAAVCVRSCGASGDGLRARVLHLTGRSAAADDIVCSRTPSGAARALPAWLIKMYGAAAKNLYGACGGMLCWLACLGLVSYMLSSAELKFNLTCALYNAREQRSLSLARAIHNTVGWPDCDHHRGLQEKREVVLIKAASALLCFRPVSCTLPCVCAPQLEPHSTGIV